MGKKEEEEVIRIAKKMDKMAQKKSGSGALDLLKELRSVPMTLELLQSTRIGMSVNAIRKQSTDEEVTSLAKSLIKSWKKLLDEPGGGEKHSEEKRKEQTTPVVSPSQGSPEAKEESSNSSSKSEPADVAPNTLISTFPRAPTTSDSVRIKCREMLASALQTGDDYIAIGAECDELGAQIEEYIFFKFKNTDMKYKNQPQPEEDCAVWQCVPRAHGQDDRRGVLAVYGFNINLLHQLTKKGRASVVLIYLPHLGLLK
uniref:Transcription elongation factor A (SII), 1 n=1 Tax=Myripristis murdjan TaxID=586833 RepID=A0A667Y6F4_9TELE